MVTYKPVFDQNDEYEDSIQEKQTSNKHELRVVL